MSDQSIEVTGKHKFKNDNSIIFCEYCGLIAYDALQSPEINIELQNKAKEPCSRNIVQESDMTIITSTNTTEGYYTTIGSMTITLDQDELGIINSCLILKFPNNMTNPSEDWTYENLEFVIGHDFDLDSKINIDHTEIRTELAKNHY